MAIAGIDVGTTGCKCTVCSDEGLLIKETYQEYDIKREDSGRELDAREVWKGVESVAGQAFAGLLVLPYFSGSATPYMDGGVRGAILGIGDDTTSIDIYQALMEGVTYEMLLNIDLLASAGIEVQELRATGGGAQAEVWLQMKADILNRKIVTLGNAQSGTLGCIMMSGVACGLFKDLKEAAGVYVKTGKEYLPEAAKHERYMEYYAKYKKLYGAVKEVME